MPRAIQRSVSHATSTTRGRGYRQRPIHLRQDRFILVSSLMCALLPSAVSGQNEPEVPKLGTDLPEGAR